ncbi:MAG TPA: precorrin-3B C(17)-methyltransferase [Stellaceae bacterium]|nr:precorrin-3B C(17)-methyltransferase [Stellaceae bacterium]
MVVNVPAVIVLGPSALDTARRVAASLGARTHGPESCVATDVHYGDLGNHLRALFRAGTPIVGICASGILIRLLAPLLADKRNEPPVVAVAEDGTAVVPLLGGHHGANVLARRIADELQVRAAITTAGDLRFAVAFDEPPDGYALVNPADVKPFSAALLAGAKVRIDGDVPWLGEGRLPLDPGGALRISVTVRAEAGGPAHLVYHPRALALGVGCERGTAAEELLDLVRAALDESGFAPAAIAGVYSLDLKSDEPAVHAVAEALHLPARFFDAATLEAETPRLANPSDLVFAEVGCHGVAEAAALAAAGPSATLVVNKRKSARATVALACAPSPFAGHTVGQAQGRVYVVGIGPGDAASMTPDAARAIDEASDLVGYGLYLDLLGALAANKRLHAFALGEEETRARVALDLAAAGRAVALVSSGDPGIYALASPLFELLERENNAAWRRVAIRVVPGISALQAAAARAGAPIGHDFCAISLSDLLTPWAVIERRIDAAARGDFVIAFYNPVSRRRGWQLARAKELLLQHRGPQTPVIVARNLGRDGERVTVGTLAALDAAEVDMLTLVLVGSSGTRAGPRGIGGAWVFTPRGYGAKGSEREAG